MTDFDLDSNGDLSKSEMFELSGHGFDTDSSSQIGENSLGFSNLDLDNELEAFKNRESKQKKQLLELRQLQHDLQLCKVELSQRDFQLSNLKLEYTTKCEQLQERVFELTHQNQMLSAKLSSVEAVHKEEDARKQENIKLELSRILVRQRELEENNERFMKNEQQIKKEIKSVDMLGWTNEDFEFMARCDEDVLTIKEFAALKLHNTTLPLKTKLEEANKKIVFLEENLQAARNELAQLKHIYQEDRKNYNVNSMDNQKLYYELADTKALLQQANFKRDNYDRTKFERDDFEKKLGDSEARVASLQATIQVLTKEKEESHRDINQLKQEISLLRQDKDYLQRQFVEVQAKCRATEDKLEQAQQQYEEIKRSREDLYDKHINAREVFKTEYEQRLTHELDELKLRTSEEIERLRSNTKEFYEREIKSLREAREALQMDKEKHELNEKELHVKLQEAQNELRLVQLTCENKVSEMKSELKLKIFEVERAQLLNEETINNYHKISIENEKLQKKLELFQNEYYTLQIQNDKRILELESELNEKKSRLDSYEKVEQEMDMVIRQVAESSESGNINETEAEKLLLSYGYGANIVMNSKRRIQQNVHLTKRILHLEQLNTALRLELDKERANNKGTLEQLDIAKSVIENTKQPHEFLVRSIQSRETQLRKQQSSIEAMQKRIDELSVERENLMRRQNEMTNDIQKLIRHNDELLGIQDELKRGGHYLSNVIRNSRPGSSILSKSNQNLHQDPGLGLSGGDQPKPLMFTSKGVQQRYALRKSPEGPRRPVYAIEKS